MVQKTITAVGTIIFLDLKINYHLKLYEEHNDYIISTLNTAFFALKAVTPLFTTHTLKLSLLHICIPLYLTLLPFGKIK